MAKKANRALLESLRLCKRFGGIQALDRVDITIPKESIISVIGPNGAGKTTFINAVTGIYPPDEGEVRLEGQNIAGLPPHEIASFGVVRTFQLEELFTSMTVLENTMTGCHLSGRSGIVGTGFSLRSARLEEKRIRESALENLRSLGLLDRADRAISSLPLGERKLVGVARALGLKPKLLMLDEPAGGLAAHEIEKMTTLIYSLVEKGLSVLIVEHNMPFVMTVSEKIFVLDSGVKIAEGSPDEIQSDQRVIKAYLGEEE